MNLSKLFEMQKELDDYIVKTKGLEEKDLMPDLLLALFVEVGECANEYAKFKFWKVNPESKPGLLEETVDCLHFILSIGLKTGFSEQKIGGCFVECGYARDCFNDLFIAIADFGAEGNASLYWNMTAQFVHLTECLDFTWEQIEQAYTDKWNINKQRQENGY